jgi:hypothetical protein
MTPREIAMSLIPEFTDGFRNNTERAMCEQAAFLAQQECAQEIERLRARDFFCVYCGQVFSGSESADTLKAHVAVCPEHPLSKANAEVERLKGELAEAKRERDLAIAHDHQPYPTAFAYEKVCEVLEKCKAALRKCAIELEYVQCVENCNSGLCATSEGKLCVEIAQKLLGPMQNWPEIKEDV